MQKHNGMSQVLRQQGKNFFFKHQ